MSDFFVIFASVPDPRDINARHDLREMLFIGLGAMLCGAESCVEMAQFGEDKEALLRTILELKHGVPSHDTFTPVFRRLDPVALEDAFIRLRMPSSASWKPLVGRLLPALAHLFWPSTARASNVPTRRAALICRR
jgi:hypothetical protein